MPPRVEGLTIIPEGTFRICFYGKSFIVSNLESSGKIAFAKFENQVLRMAGKYTQAPEVKFEVVGDRMHIFPVPVGHDEMFMHLQVEPEDLLSAGSFKYSVLQGKIITRMIDPWSSSLERLFGEEFSKRSRDYAKRKLAGIFGEDYKIR